MIAAEIERCAGIDVGKERLAVCVMVGPLAGEPRIEYREYGTVTAELERLRQWLQAEGVTHVVMESTGSYWKPIFNVLEEKVKVYLAKSQDVKNRKGHKTDKKDSWWLAHLLRHAMIRPSFVPPRGLRGCEYQTQQCAVRHFRGFRPIDVGGLAGGQSHRRRDRPVCPARGETKGSANYSGAGRASHE